MSSEVGIAILIGLAIGAAILGLAFMVMRLAKRGKVDKPVKSVKQVTSTVVTEATFNLGELMISPVEAREGERVSISFRVSNVGNTHGIYKAKLRINGVEIGNLDIDLASGETELATFAVAETVAGEYKVEVDGLEEVLLFLQPGLVLVLLISTLGELRKEDTLALWLR